MASTITAVKTFRTLASAGTSCNAGGTVNGTTWGDGTTGIGALKSAPGVCTIGGQITNGATGPTVQCTATVFYSGDGTTWETLTSIGGGTVASAITNFNYDLPEATLYAYIQFTGNTGQAVTVWAYGFEYTSMSAT